jgi:uncharacterized repeat protein (TIGR01451 family)
MSGWIRPTRAFVLALLALVASLSSAVTATHAAGDPTTWFGIAATVSSPAIVGAPLTYTLTGTNQTTDTASMGVLLEYPVSLKPSGLPAGCIHQKTGGSFDFINCSLGTLAGGASGTATFSLVPQVAGTIDSFAWSFGTISGITTTSPTSIDLTSQVAPAPTDIQVTGFASTGSPTVGSTFTYTFQVKNNGPQPAPGVSFADVIPDGETFVSASTNLVGQTCELSAGQVSCSLGDLAVGAQANVTLTVIAPPTPATITDTATVSMTVTDLKPSNNSVAVTVQIK